MTTCNAPATTIAARTYGKPSMASPVGLKATADAATTAINPAAGPLIVR